MFMDILGTCVIGEGKEAALEGLNEGETVEDQESRRHSTVDARVQRFCSDGLGL